MSVVVCLATLVERGRAATIHALEKSGLSNLYLVNRSSSLVGARRLTVANVEKLADLLSVRSTVAVRIVSKNIVVRGTAVKLPVYAIKGDLRQALGARPV